MSKYEKSFKNHLIKEKGIERVSDTRENLVQNRLLDVDRYRREEVKCGRELKLNILATRKWKEFNS